MKRLLLSIYILLISFDLIQSQEATLISEIEVELNNDHNCLDSESRSSHIKKLQELKSKNLVKSANIIGFNWPLKASNSYEHNGYYTISNYVDHSINSNDLQDYNCGERTYDLQNGYNHQGTDIFLWPYGWDLMANDYVEVIAAADGIIIDKFDGNTDQNCDFTNNLWNAIYLEHSDGSITWYGHLKENSLTNKGIGESVSQGEVIGIVGSSGFSTGPHLHFEVYDDQMNLIDPFEGACNSNNPSTWWNDQPDYISSQLSRVATHNSPPEIGQCVDETSPNFWNFFNPGDSIYFCAYYGDLLNSDISTFRIRDTQGDIYYEWVYSTTEPYYNAVYLNWVVEMSESAELGPWTFETEFNGTTLSHEFQIVDSPTGLEAQQNKVHSNIKDKTLHLKSDKVIHQLVLYNLQGQLISEDKLDSKESQTNFSHLSSGIYLIKIQLENEESLFKIAL